MSIIDTIMEVPWLYILLIILLSWFYAFREVRERKMRLSNDAKENARKIAKENHTDKDAIKYAKEYGNKFVIFYVRDFLSQFICTISSFVALFIANNIFSKIESFKDISAGTAILLIFLIILGITGASGYLQYLIVSGKFMGLKTKQE